MNFQIVFSSVSLIIFGGFVVLAIMGFRSIGKATEKTAGHKETGRMLAAQRPRVLRPRRSERRAGLLPPDATVTFAAERRAADIGEVFAALDSDLVGLVPVKKKVQEIAALLLVDRARRRFGLEAPRPNLHMCFTGPRAPERPPWRCGWLTCCTGSAT